MAAAGEAGPQRVEPVLPSCNAWLRRASVLDEEEDSARLQHAAHFGQSARRIGNSAERPGRHHGIHAVVVERQGFGRSFEELDRHCCGSDAAARHAQIATAGRRSIAVLRSGRKPSGARLASASQPADGREVGEERVRDYLAAATQDIERPADLWRNPT